MRIGSEKDAMPARIIPVTLMKSLRHIAASLLALATKLYHMDFRVPIWRSTLADVNESRDWRIYEPFLQSSARTSPARLTGSGKYGCSVMTRNAG
jgi:hypothetical protein